MNLLSSFCESFCGGDLYLSLWLRGCLATTAFPFCSRRFVTSQGSIVNFPPSFLMIACLPATLNINYEIKNSSHRLIVLKPDHYILLIFPILYVISWVLIFDKLFWGVFSLSFMLVSLCTYNTRKSWTRLRTVFRPFVRSYIYAFLAEYFYKVTSSLNMLLL